MRLFVVALAAIRASALVLSWQRQRQPVRTRAVWSDSTATIDYQNFLDGKVEERKSDGPAVVVATLSDALGRGFAEMAPGVPDQVVDFTDELPERLDASRYYDAPTDFPIYVSCAAPDLVEGLLQRCPDSKREDLVFLNYGDFIEPILKRYGCGRDRQTQAVVYMAVNEFGKIEEDRCSLGEDMMGQPKYAAETSVTGKWAGHFADRLARNSFYCSELFYRDWRRTMLEKVAFESIYHLVGVLHKSVPVKEVHDYFADEADEMVYEFNRCLRGHLAVTLLSGAEERMAAYAQQHFRSKSDNKLTAVSLRRASFRNLFFYGISTDMLQRGLPDPTPMHTEYWEYGIQNRLVGP